MGFSHFDKEGKPNMVDVGDKDVVNRVAKAVGFIQLTQQTIALIQSNEIQKGNVLVIAQVAGIQAAKKTDELIPLCHRLNISKVDLQFEYQSEGIQCVSEVRCQGKTGVEMEALTAVSTALLTIYDMCKAVDKQMVIKEVYLEEKMKRPLG